MSRCRGSAECERESFHARIEKLDLELPSGPHKSEAVFAGLSQRRGRWRFTEYARIDNVGDRNYAGSVIVNEANARYYEPSPRRNTSVGVQAALQF